MNREPGKRARGGSDRRQDEKAFSLIELLVVVAVVSVLMAVVLPALSMARVAARRIRCQANLRQIATGYLTYLGDNDGRFYGDLAGTQNDPFSQPKNPEITFGGWPGRLGQIDPRPVNGCLGLRIEKAGEHEAEKPFRCPADTRANNHERSTLFGSVYTDLGNSYEVSRFIAIPYEIPVEGMPEPWQTINGRIRAQGPVTLHTIAQHQGLLWIADYFWMSQWDPRPRNPMPPCSYWHGRRHHFSAVFLDGHTAFVRITRGIYEYDDGYRVQPPLVEGIRSLQTPGMCSCGEY